MSAQTDERSKPPKTCYGKKKGTFPTYDAILNVVDKLQSEDPELYDYIQNRVATGICFYQTEGDKAQRRYIWMRSIAVVAGAFVPVLINVNLGIIKINDISSSINTLFTTLLSLVVVILVSLEGVLHYRERYKNYRSTSHAIEQECFLLLMRGPPYDKCGEDKSKLRAEFVKRTEAYISREVTSTLSTMTVEPTAEGQGKPTAEGQGKPTAEGQGYAGEQRR